VSEDEPWQGLLRDALAVLALPPDEQLRANCPDCVACDFSNGFYHAHLFTLESAPELSDVQRSLLARIDTAIRAMEGPGSRRLDRPHHRSRFHHHHGPPGGQRQLQRGRQCVPDLDYPALNVAHAHKATQDRRGVLVVSEMSIRLRSSWQALLQGRQSPAIMTLDRRRRHAQSFGDLQQVGCAKPMAIRD